MASHGIHKILHVARKLFSLMRNWDSRRGSIVFEYPHFSTKVDNFIFLTVLIYRAAIYFHSRNSTVWSIPRYSRIELNNFAGTIAYMSAVRGIPVVFAVAISNYEVVTLVSRGN